MKIIRKFNLHLIIKLCSHFYFLKYSKKSYLLSFEFFFYRFRKFHQILFQIFKSSKQKIKPFDYNFKINIIIKLL